MASVLSMMPTNGAAMAFDVAMSCCSRPNRFHSWSHCNGRSVCDATLCVDKSGYRQLIHRTAYHSNLHLCQCKRQRVSSYRQKQLQPIVWQVGHHRLTDGTRAQHFSSPRSLLESESTRNPGSDKPKQIRRLQPACKTPRIAVLKTMVKRTQKHLPYLWDTLAN